MKNNKKTDAYLTKNFICVKDEKGEKTYYMKSNSNIKEIMKTYNVRKGRNSKKVIE